MNLQRIKELREKATQGEWDNVWGVSEDDELYIVALHNYFPQLLKEHEALLRFVEKVKSAIGMTHPEDVANMTMEALQALDKELKG